MLSGILQRLWYAWKFVLAQTLLGLLEMLYKLQLLERPKKDPVPGFNCFVTTGTPIENGIGPDFSNLYNLVQRQGLTSKEFLNMMGGFATGGKIDMKKVRGGKPVDTSKIPYTPILSQIERVVYVNGEKYSPEKMKPEQLERIKKGLSKLEQAEIEKLFFSKEK